MPRVVDVMLLIATCSAGEIAHGQVAGPLRNPRPQNDPRSMRASARMPAPALPGLGLVEIPLAGVVVGKLIQQFQDAASRLLFEGENRGNALLVTLGNQMRVATQNADVLLKDQQNTLFDNLGVSSQTFFTTLNQILLAANGPIDRAVSVLEVANLDLIELTNRLPLTEKTYIYINKVTGLTQPYGPSGYVVNAQGLGFGQDMPNRRYRLRVRIANKEVPASQITRTPPFSLSIALDHALMESFFADAAIKTVPLSIEAAVLATNTCYVFFSCTDSIGSTWNLKVVLLPRFPGELKGSEVMTRQALDGVTKVTSVDVTTSGCKSDRPCDWTRTIALASNERVVGVRYACSGQCGWSYNMRHGGYGPDYDILEGGTKVVVYRHVDGEGSTTVTHYVDYQTLKTTEAELEIAPLKLQFGAVTRLRLSPGNTACAYRLSASLVTHQDVYFDNSMTQSPDGLLVRVGTGQGPAGTPCAPTFKLNVP